MFNNELLEKAQSGDRDAMFEVGMGYLLRGDSEEDVKKGDEWLTKAANAGHAEAQCCVGEGMMAITLDVLSTTDDDDEIETYEYVLKGAVERIKESSDSGFARAKVLLSDLYLNPFPIDLSDIGIEEGDYREAVNLLESALSLAEKNGWGVSSKEDEMYKLCNNALSEARAKASSQVNHKTISPTTPGAPKKKSLIPGIVVIGLGLITFNEIMILIIPVGIYLLIRAKKYNAKLQ